MSVSKNWKRSGFALLAGAIVHGGVLSALAQSSVTDATTITSPAGATPLRSLDQLRPSDGIDVRPPGAVSKTSIPTPELASALEVSDRLTARARSAFDRGLMGIADYSTQLEAAKQLRLRIADRLGDAAAKSRAHQDHISALRDAARGLEQFNQPASKGWAADTTMAALLVADSELALAAAHLDQRLDDYSVGLATLPQLAKAASYLEPSTATNELTDREDREHVRSMADYRNRLTTILEATEEMARRGAGRGRVDHVLRARAELATATASMTGNTADAASLRSLAVESASAAFDAQTRYYQTGTASLFDLADQWLLLRSLQPGADLQDDTSPLRRDLEVVTEMANETRDLRGRNAADVSFVDVLAALDRLDRSKVKRDSKPDEVASPGNASTPADGTPMPESVQP